MPIRTHVPGTPFTADDLIAAEPFDFTLEFRLAAAAPAPRDDAPFLMAMTGTTAIRDSPVLWSTTDANSSLAVGAAAARLAYGVDGTGLNIGILSDSFNNLGGMAADIASGDLPAGVTIVKDLASGGTDEGRAMAELLHQIAPGANIFFYSAYGGQADFASGITTLATTYDCQIIIDDVSYFAEAFYQEGGIVAQAIDAVVASGVSYFTSAGNNGDKYYEAAFNPISVRIPGIVGRVTAHDAGGGSPYEAVTIGLGATVNFDLQWAQAFASFGSGGGATYGLGLAIYSLASGSPVLVGGANSAGVGQDPVNVVSYTNNTGSTSFALVFFVDAGTATTDMFKVIALNTSQVTFTGAGAGIGSGTIFGHNGAPLANTIGAIRYSNTPAFGSPTPVQESFSSYGGQVYYYDADGNALASPVLSGGVDFSAPDGSGTAVPGFAPFYGTSAAAPNAGAVGALMLAADARLVPVQVTYILSTTAIATANTLNGGAGLVDANAAVGLAHLAATTPIFTGQAGTLLWASTGNWSDNAVPSGTETVTLSDGLGLFEGGYTVTLDAATVSIGTLVVDGGALAAPVLSVGSGHSIALQDGTIGVGGIDVAGSLLDGGALATTGTGGVDILAGGLVEVGGALGATITFHGAGTLMLGTTATLTDLAGTIFGLTAASRLDLTGLPWDPAQTVAVSGDTVTISLSGVPVAVLSIAGRSMLTLASDGSGDTPGTLVVACYARGTRIATPSGPCPIEGLAVGMTVMTPEGPAAIAWIGRRRHGPAALAADPTLRPIEIAPGALGPGRPAGMLRVSSQHALRLVTPDGAPVLVPAAALLGLPDIRRGRDDGPVEYLHLALDRHALVLAEGAWAETFLPQSGAALFDSSLGRLPARAMPCLPRLEGGPELERMRARLPPLDVPGMAPGPLRGHVEMLASGPGHRRIAGWAQDAAQPDRPVALDVLVDGRIVARLVANTYRADLERAGLGDGRAGFACDLPPIGAILVRRAGEGAALPWSPALRRAA